GQEDDAEMFRSGTLAEAGAVHDRHVLLANEFGDKDVVALRDVDARVRIKSTARLDTTDARSFGAPMHGQVAAATQLALDFDEVILRAFERGLDRVLLRVIGAEARPQQFVYAFEIRFDNRSFAAGNTPSDAPSGSEVILGQPAEGDDRHVGRYRGHGNVRVVGFPIDGQFGVNLIGEDDQVVLAREFGYLLEHLAGAERAGGIVGVDQHNPARPGRDLSLDVVEIGLPAVFFVQVIRIQSDFELRENRGVERIVGAGSQQVVARIEKRGQADILRRAVPRGYEDILNVGDAFARGLAADGVERFLDARRWRVSILTVAHGLIDGFDHVGGRLKVEVERVADVEGQNFVSLAGYVVGDAGQVANGVADVFQAGGGGDFAGLSHRH